MISKRRFKDSQAKLVISTESELANNVSDGLSVTFVT